MQDLVPIDSVNQFSIVREQMKQVFNGFLQLKDVTERMVERSKQEASDMLLFGKELWYVIKMMLLVSYLYII